MENKRVDGSDKLRRLEHNNITSIEYKGEKVLLTEQLAEVYETDVNNIKNNFNRNKSKFQRKIHYYYLEGDELKEFKSWVTESDLVSKYTKNLYLWTRRGASRHCKILDTDKAWEQFDNLEEVYFKSMEEPKLPMTYKESLKELLRVEEEREKLEIENRQHQQALQEAQPHINYSKAIQDTGEAIGIRDFNHIINKNHFEIGEEELVDWLLDKKYMYRDRKGRLRGMLKHIKDTKYLIEDPYIGKGFISYKVKITHKGQVRFIARLQEEMVKKRLQDEQIDMF